MSIEVELPAVLQNRPMRDLPTRIVAPAFALQKLSLSNFTKARINAFIGTPKVLGAFTAAR